MTGIRPRLPGIAGYLLGWVALAVLVWMRPLGPLSISNIWAIAGLVLLAVFVAQAGVGLLLGVRGRALVLGLANVRRSRWELVVGLAVAWTAQTLVIVTGVDPLGAPPTNGPSDDVFGPQLFWLFSCVAIAVVSADVFGVWRSRHRDTKVESEGRAP
jgi:hypothetical protein